MPPNWFSVQIDAAIPCKVNSVIDQPRITVVLFRSAIGR